VIFIIVPAANLFFWVGQTWAICRWDITPPADVLEEGIGCFEEVTQQDISLVTLSGSKRVDASVEMIEYQTTMFTKSRAIGQLGKRRIPTHPMKQVNDG
jgi:hypothetical protein